jgi:hypothetical protein
MRSRRLSGGASARASAASRTAAGQPLVARWRAGASWAVVVVVSSSRRSRRAAVSDSVNGGRPAARRALEGRGELGGRGRGGRGGRRRRVVVEALQEGGRLRFREGQPVGAQLRDLALTAQAFDREGHGGPAHEDHVDVRRRAAHEALDEAHRVAARPQLLEVIEDDRQRAGRRREVLADQIGQRVGAPPVQPARLVAVRAGPGRRQDRPQVRGLRPGVRLQRRRQTADQPGDRAVQRIEGVPDDVAPALRPVRDQGRLAIPRAGDDDRQPTMDALIQTSLQPWSGQRLIRDRWSRVTGRHTVMFASARLSGTRCGCTA